MKNIMVIGSTGSIGRNALEVVRRHPGRFRITGLAAGSNERAILEQAREFKPGTVCLWDRAAAGRLTGQLPSGTKVYAGEDGLLALAEETPAELLIAASSGSSSLVPVLAALRRGISIGIANKELLVMAGHLVIKEARKSGARLLPVDSEHNAIFQCLEGCRRTAEVRRILLTGSGGPLKDLPEEAFKGLRPEFVIRHPRWSMGPKISVDSATLMNKGLELIEACWLFGVDEDRVRVMIHPEAAVHSMVEFIDGSVIAQMGVTDMKLPLTHVMHYPERANAPSLSPDLAAWRCLNFSEPDLKRFPCLGFAREAAKKRHTTATVVLNAADEVAVGAFLEGGIDFSEIPSVIEKVLTARRPERALTLEEILRADRWAREEAFRHCGVPR